MSVFQNEFFELNESAAKRMLASFDKSTMTTTPPIPSSATVAVNSHSKNLSLLNNVPNNNPATVADEAEEDTFGFEQGQDMESVSGYVEPPSPPPLQNKEEPPKSKAVEAAKNAGISKAQSQRLFAIAHANHWATPDVKELLQMQTGKTSTLELNYKEYKTIVDMIEKNPRIGQR